MKLLASDLDGTLYFNHQTPKVKPQDIEAIKAFQKAGNLFGICSGRTLAGIHHALNEQDIHLDFYILVSGAALADKNGHFIYQHRLSKATIRKIVTAIEHEKEAEVLFCHEENYYLLHPSGSLNRRGKIIQDIDEALENDFDSLHIAFEHTDTLERVKEILKSKLDDEIEIHHNVLNLDITPKGFSKGKAIKTLENYLPIRLEDIATIGDSFNDISMLQAAPTSFTFHTSEASVKANAKHIVADISEAINLLTKED